MVCRREMKPSAFDHILLSIQNTCFTMAPGGARRWRLCCMLGTARRRAMGFSAFKFSLIKKKKKRFYMAPGGATKWRLCCMFVFVFVFIYIPWACYSIEQVRYRYTQRSNNNKSVRQNTYYACKNCWTS